MAGRQHTRTQDRTFIPAAGWDWALPFYDSIGKLFGGDRARELLLEDAALRPGHRVLDIGCGTGSLAVLIKRQHADVEVVGLDPDPRALARAKRKAERARVSIQLDQGFSDRLPYPAGSFDRVLSSFMLHHLDVDERKRTLHEARRALKPGAILLLVDFGGPGPGPRGLVRLFHASHGLRDNFENRIPALMRQAGLADPIEIRHTSTVLGPIAYYQASAAPDEG